MVNTEIITLLKNKLTGLITSHNSSNTAHEDIRQSIVTYSPATTSSSGLMSCSDKEKLESYDTVDVVVTYEDGTTETKSLVISDGGGAMSRTLYFTPSQLIRNNGTQIPFEKSKGVNPLSCDIDNNNVNVTYDSVNGRFIIEDILDGEHQVNFLAFFYDDSAYPYSFNGDITVNCENTSFEVTFNQES